MMRQLLLFPAWADEMNLWFADCNDDSWAGRVPDLVWLTFWIEFLSAREASSLARSFYRDYKTRPLPDGAWISGRAVDRYICLRRLPTGPIYKLSEWDQLDTGRVILLHPEPSDEDVSLAEGRASRFRREGRGRFDVQHRDDGTLWVTKLG